VLGISLTGLALTGALAAGISIPTLPEVIHAVKEKEGIEESPILNDKGSALFNVSFSLGCMIGPILGGFLSD